MLFLKGNFMSKKGQRHMILDLPSIVSEALNGSRPPVTSSAVCDLPHLMLSTSNRRLGVQGPWEPQELDGHTL